MIPIVKEADKQHINVPIRKISTDIYKVKQFLADIVATDYIIDGIVAFTTNVDTTTDLIYKRNREALENVLEKLSMDKGSNPNGQEIMDEIAVQEQEIKENSERRDPPFDGGKVGSDYWGEVIKGAIEIAKGGLINEITKIADEKVKETEKIETAKKEEAVTKAETVIATVDTTTSSVSSAKTATNGRGSGGSSILAEAKQAREELDKAKTSVEEAINKAKQAEEAKSMGITADKSGVEKTGSPAGELLIGAAGIVVGTNGGAASTFLKSVPHILNVIANAGFQNITIYGTKALIGGGMIGLVGGLLVEKGMEKLAEAIKNSETGTSTANIGKNGGDVIINTDNGIVSISIPSGKGTTRLDIGKDFVQTKTQKNDTSTTTTYQDIIDGKGKVDLPSGTTMEIDKVDPKTGVLVETTYVVNGEGNVNKSNETITFPDDSTVTTSTAPNGTKNTTVTNSKGETTYIQTKPDGTQISTANNNGTKTVVINNTDGSQVSTATNTTTGTSSTTAHGTEVGGTYNMPGGGNFTVNSKDSDGTQHISGTDKDGNPFEGTIDPDGEVHIDE